MKRQITGKADITLNEAFAKMFNLTYNMNKNYSVAS